MHNSNNVISKHRELSGARLNHKLQEVDRKIKNLQEDKKELVTEVFTRVKLPTGDATAFANDYFQFNRRRVSSTTNKDQLLAYLSAHEEVLAKATITVPLSAINGKPMQGVKITFQNWAVKAK